MSIELPPVNHDDRSPDGQEHPPAPIPDLQRPAGVGAPVRDAEERLRAIQERLRLAQSYGGVGVWSWDLPAGTLSVEPEMEQLYGVAPGSIRTYRDWAARVHPEDLERLEAARDQALADGQPFQAEFRIRDARGGERWLLAKGRGEYDADGRPVRVLGVNIDITERKQDEERTARLLERLTLLVDHTPLAVVEWDAQFRVTRWSGQAEQLFGWEADEVLGCRLEELPLVYQEDLPKVRQTVKRLIDPASQFVVSRNRNNTREGRVVSCEWYNSVLHDANGRMVAVLSLILDVTERERAMEALRNSVAERMLLEQQLREKMEELAEADRRKDEFLAMLAHELRNPLGPIRSAAHLLRLQGSADPQLQRHRETIERQVGNMAQLLDDLLDVSRVTGGIVRLRRERLDFVAVVADSIESCTSMLEERGHLLEVHLPAEELPVHADRLRLEQVVMNLLTNAAKYTSPGGTITVRVVREGERAALHVKDTGRGIAAELLPHLFELFFQAERGLARSEGGLGIGLTLVKRLAELHGGTVEAHSPGPGKGSEFVVWLPLLATATAVAVRAPVPGSLREKDGKTGGSVRVLVVDDLRDNAETLADLLALWGYEVCVALGGAEALEEAACFRPHAVFLDIGMPGMDGYEVARQLRDSVAPEAFLVAMTGYGQEQDRRQAREAGFDEHLMKPVDPDQLHRLLLDRYPAGNPAGWSVPGRDRHQE